MHRKGSFQAEHRSCSCDRRGRRPGAEPLPDSDQPRQCPVGYASAGGCNRLHGWSDGLTVSCTAFELAGVGNTNAVVKLDSQLLGGRRLLQPRWQPRRVPRDDVLGHK